MLSACRSRRSKDIEVEKLEKATSSELKSKCTRTKIGDIDQGFIRPINDPSLFNKVIKVLKIIRPLLAYLRVFDSSSYRISDVLPLTNQLEETL